MFYDFYATTSSTTNVWSWVQVNPPEQPPLAGVREPRQPYPVAPTGAIALEIEHA